MRPERTRVPDISGGPQAMAIRQAARAAVLLDRLRRCEIWPFMLQAEVTNLAQDVVTRMNTDDLKNESGGVLAITRGRIFSDTAKSSTSSIAAPFTNVSIRVLDNDGARPLTKRPTPLPIMFARDTNTWVLDRPHVISERGSLSAYLTERNSVATTDVSLMVMGDAVIGDLTASELDELIGMGLYPGVAGSGGGWVRSLLFSMLAGDEPVPGLPAEAELAMLSLRERAASLRLLLASGRSRAAVLEASVADIPSNGTADLPSDSLRNDTGWPMLVTRLMTNVVIGPQDTAVAVPPRTAVSADLSVVAGKNRHPLVWRPTVAALIGAGDSGEWNLDRPMVLEPGAAVECKAYEVAGAGSLDMFLSVHGQLIEGIGTAELRECVALGLLDGWRAQRD